MQTLEDFEKKTLYELLGVPRSATEVEIREAYREIARVYHPDSGFYRDLVDYDLGERDVRIFQLVTNAYNTLIREEQRAAYDLTLGPDLSPPLPEPAHTHDFEAHQDDPLAHVEIGRENTDLLRKMRDLVDERVVVEDPFERPSPVRRQATEKRTSHPRNQTVPSRASSFAVVTPPELVEHPIRWYLGVAIFGIGMALVAVLVWMAG